MIEMQSGGGGGNSQSIAAQIRASIERAKVYPALARKRRQEGTVIAEFSINTKGYPQNIQIIKSSGFSLLDSAIRDTILKASPFPVIRGTIEVPLTFILKSE
jgi:protein TonB